MYYRGRFLNYIYWDNAANRFYATCALNSMVVEIANVLWVSCYFNVSKITRCIWCVHGAESYLNCFTLVEQRCCYEGQSKNQCSEVFGFFLRLIALHNFCVYACVTSVKKSFTLVNVCELVYLQLVYPLLFGLRRSLVLHNRHPLVCLEAALISSLQHLQQRRIQVTEFNITLSECPYECLFFINEFDEVS